MSQEQSVDKVSVIYYDKKNRPKYLELPITLFRSLIYILPTITIVALAVVIAGILYFKQVKEMAKRSESQEIINLRKDNTEIKTKYDESVAIIEALKNKLANQNVKDLSALQDVGFFKPIVGQVDLSSTPPASIQDLDFTVTADRIQINFKIQNDNKDGKKMIGYVFIIQQAGNRFTVYPDGAYESGQLIAAFNKGELFGATRFRPTSASFPKALGENLFRIIIFSSTGDVVLKQIVKHVVE